MHVLKIRQDLYKAVQGILPLAVLPQRVQGPHTAQSQESPRGKREEADWLWRRLELMIFLSSLNLEATHLRPRQTEYQHVYDLLL